MYISCCVFIDSLSLLFGKNAGNTVFALAFLLDVGAFDEFGP